MPTDQNAYRAQSLGTWEQMAPGWEHRRAWLMGVGAPVNAWLVEQLDAQPGQTVLELAAGTGDLGFAVAERVGDDGRVVSTDFAPAMVDVARRAGAARGLANVDHRVMDAEQMELGDDAVDGVVCRWGYMLMADPAAALAETRRVLRDGGRLAFAVWTAPDRNPWAAVPGRTFVELGHMPPPDPEAPGIMALGDPARIRALLAAAGFAEPRIEEIPVTFRHPDFDDVWDTLVQIAGPLAHVIRSLPDAEREAARSAAMRNLESFRAEDGSYAMPGSSWGVLTH
jgi:ubiquinone/menaquinone biosynthesis C-methylase UbiE